MASLFLSTPYTPIFPPPLPKKPFRKASRSDDDDSSSCHHHQQNDNNNNNNDVPYIQKLKQRYLRLASVPHELCAPSREISPEAQTRIDYNRSRIRSRREMRLPLELALTCVGVAGGDWVGESLSEDNDDQYILPHSEAEWFQWERRRKALREKRRAERQAEERRNDIAKWTEGIQLDNVTPLQDIPPLFPELMESLPVPVVEPSPPPAAPVLEPLHDFNDSISGNSAPSIPFSITAFVDTVRRITAPSISLPLAPVLIPPSPPLIPLPPPPPLVRPTMIEQSRETFVSQNNLLCGSNPQLSSPISPPRSLKPLSGTPGDSFPVSSKRLHQDDDDEDKNDGAGSRLSIDSRDILETPRPNKRFKAGDEPITPKSVERPSLPSSSQLQGPSSQAVIGNEEIKRLPTLMDLIANSSRKSSRRGTPGQRSSRSSHTPRHGALALPELLPPSSQLSFSMFLPQAESTQVHDLPPD
ncbi:hypothetical protein Clacol_006003 [Clathrus columnatus]|uniref:PEHE domain-containing protein n=1 Tax=Clathrus columnatus TaxID=1419009 RepID=A0AAV5AFU1_9AGAM|nr:hypothetical protein Clacol_006003 [Clathrus columnatus]